LFFHALAEDGFYVYAFNVLVYPYQMKIGQKTPEGEVVVARRSDFLKSVYRGYYELMFDELDRGRRIAF
jgi:hypothetical protein